MADPESGLSSGIMSRIASVWLRSWPIARLLRAQASASSVDTGILHRLDPNRSLVLVTPGKGGQRIVSLNTAARNGGLSLGELLSNARSKVLDLQVCDADPITDAKALQKLALWAMQYSPLVTAWDEANGADGLFLNITGCAHLFGGEERLLVDLQLRLRSFGLYPRLAVAGTAGAAWALARHGKRNLTIIPSGAEREALANLPLTALRLPDEAVMVLRRLGFRRSGELIDQPRAPFGTRFNTTLLSRLDQALGRAPEPLIPVVPPPIYRAQVQFLEPIMDQEQVLQAATRLLETLVQDLTRDAVGARLLRLLLFKMDGEAVSLDLGLAAPSRDARHIAQLIGLRLYRLQSAFETDFGFEAAALHVLSADDMAEHQHQFAISTHTAAPEELARLVDRLQHRLGGGAVRQFRALQSHIPERAVMKIKGFKLTTAMTATLRHDRRDRQACLQHDEQSCLQQDEQACLRHDEPRRENPSPTRQASVSPTRQASVSPTRQASVSTTRRKTRSNHPSQDKSGTMQGADVASLLSWVPEPSSGPRPLMMLPRPEAADVVALVPEGPPRQFRWRGVLHQVADSEGPERIAPEWWRRKEEATRDYYIVEDTAGRRFWLFRAGLYDRETDAPQWFVHGVFG